MVGVTGIEPVTPSMSTKCSPAELYAQNPMSASVFSKLGTESLICVPYRGKWGQWQGAFRGFFAFLGLRPISNPKNPCRFARFNAPRPNSNPSQHRREAPHPVAKSAHKHLPLPILSLQSPPLKPQQAPQTPIHHALAAAF